MSQERRRLSPATCAPGWTAALILLIFSFLVTVPPASASAAPTKQFTYTCTGQPFTSTSITVGLSAPDSVTAGQAFDLTVNVPALTLATAPAAATTVQVTLALTPTGGSSSDTPAKTGATVTAGQTAVPAGTVTYKVTPATGTATKVAIRPGELKLSLAGAPATATTCTTTSSETLDVPIGTGGGGNADDIVTYACTSPSVTGYDADVDIKVVMTTPTGAKAGEDASITWTGTIQSTGDPLQLPAGADITGAKLFATVKASGADAPATATGEAALSATAGSDITTLPSITVKIKPAKAGTVSLTAGDLAVGSSSTAPVIKCTAPASGLKAYTFTVAEGSRSPDPTPSGTMTRTATATVTLTPPEETPSVRKSRTPKAGADTGAGGTMGPDGRLFILTGTGLVAAAAIGGLITRRRSSKG